MQAYRSLAVVAFLAVGVSAVLAGLRFHKQESCDPAPAPTQTAADYPALAHLFPDHLEVGKLAPDFTLPDPAGRTQVTLSDYRGKRPVVLVFGSATCLYLRRQTDTGNLEWFRQTYGDRAEIVLVYTREVHPDLLPNYLRHGDELLKTVRQAGEPDARAAVAAAFAAQSCSNLTTVVDGPDDAVARAYAGFPYRVVVVAADGTVAYKGPPDRRGQYLSDVGEWLDLDTAARSAEATGAGGPSSGKETASSSPRPAGRRRHLL